MYTTIFPVSQPEEQTRPLVITRLGFNEARSSNKDDLNEVGRPDVWDQTPAPFACTHFIKPKWQNITLWKQKQQKVKLSAACFWVLGDDCTSLVQTTGVLHAYRKITLPRVEVWAHWSHRVTSDVKPQVAVKEGKFHSPYKAYRIEKNTKKPIQATDTQPK